MYDPVTKRAGRGAAADEARAGGEMRLTERDKLVLQRSFAALLWFGLLGWALYYSFWLGLAVSLYFALQRRFSDKLWKF
jgi:hypothetical protein